MQDVYFGAILVFPDYSDFLDREAPLLGEIQENDIDDEPINVDV